MGFLSGSLTFQRYRVHGENPPMFGPEHIEVLEQHASGPPSFHSAEQVQIGFLAGAHLLDSTFDLEKNIINDALHFGVRLDSNQIPAAIRNAWMQMELAALMPDAPMGRPTKAQRQEAKEAVERRCEDEIRTGKYHRMQHFPVLWDARQRQLYFGGSSTSASELCADLVARAFDVELERMSAGNLAIAWAEEQGRRAALDAIEPAVFHPQLGGGEIAWCNNMSGNFDFLGNEFLLWLWWYVATQSDVLPLADGSEANLMLSRSLVLECPQGASGKESITAECPIVLPEAAQAIRSGKLPRRSGLMLARHGQAFEFVLQAETFSVGAAKLHMEDDDADARGMMENRIDMIRSLAESLDLVFFAFCERRVSEKWEAECERMRRWLHNDAAASKKPAA